jgi:hypothetical protein
MTVYLAADRPLDPPYTPELGGLSIHHLTTAEAAAFRAFSKPHRLAVGFSNRCGCYVRHFNERPRRVLVWLLEWALGVVPEVEVFVCDADREGEVPASRDWSSATELLAWHELEAGTFLTVRGE